MHFVTRDIVKFRLIFEISFHFRLMSDEEAVVSREE